MRDVERQPFELVHVAQQIVNARQRLENSVEVRRGLKEPLDVVRAQRVDLGVFIGDEVHDDARELGFPEKVVVVCHELDVIAVLPAHDFKGSRADRLRVEPKRIDARILGEQVRRDDF